MSQFMARYMAGRLSTPRLFFEALREERQLINQGDTTMERFTGQLRDGARFEALERLKEDKRYFTTDRYLAQQHQADWADMVPDIQRFAAHFVKKMRRYNIPMFVHTARNLERNGPFAVGAAVVIIHSRYTWMLSPKEWQLVHKIGYETARLTGVAVETSIKKPALWSLADWPSYPLIKQGDHKPVRKTATKLLREIG